MQLEPPSVPAKFRMHWNGYIWPAYTASTYANYVSCLCNQGQSTIYNLVCDYYTPPNQLLGPTGVPVAQIVRYPTSLLP